ncbi:Aminoglycoside phosphotransferase [Burkholderiales bacterium]|nr:Aminoglycoside phosphotransferase [Burkholderiales bacterium]
MTRERPFDERLELLRSWLQELAATFELRLESLRPASSDASFRRYFRIDAGTAAGSYVAMDAPPAHEDCRPFVHVAGLLAQQGVSTPQILACDIDRGLLLLSDFGVTTYASALLQPGVDADALYADALAALVRMQGAQPGSTLPAYDGERLLAEMRLFADWYVARQLGQELTAREREVLQATFDVLLGAATAQAQVLVHRDYHCRNLMVLDPPQRNPGVLDFQDAVVGPVTYDLVSLLRDAYVEWPEAQQLDWAARYWEQARDARLPVPASFDLLWRDLEWMGLQRSLKVLGIFARLCHRDGKPAYLADIPLVLRHTQRVVDRYDTFRGLARVLERVHERAPQTGYSF